MTTATVQQLRREDRTTIEIDPFDGLVKRRRVSSQPAIAVLDIECNQLARTWKRFHEFLPPSDRVSFQQGLQETCHVLRVIDEAVNVWESCKHRRLFTEVIRQAGHVASSIASHFRMMQFVRDGREYGSLFYGVVQSIIKASIKQYRVAEGFLTSLAQINKAVRKAFEETPYDSSPNLDHRIADLYCQIFLFLGEFMDLYIAKGVCRQLDSHTEDFLSDFRNLIQSIKSSARAISTNDVNGRPRESKYKLPRQFVAVNEARLKQVGREGPERRNAAQSVFVLQQIWDARRHIDMKRELTAEREPILADLVASLRPHVSIPGNTVPEEVVSMADRMDSTPDGHTSPDLLSSPTGSNARRRLTRLSLQFQSRDLQDWFSHDDQIYDFDPVVRLSVDPSIAMALYDWTRSLRSQTIAISGDQPVALPDATTQLCACYVSLARQQHIPVISHFCSVRRYTTGDRRARAERGLIALAYSLIRQLIELAPPMFNCDSACDLSADRFGRLDGTMASWKDALSMVDILLAFAPPILFCAIDGLDLLEVPSTEDCLRSLVQVLVSHTTRRAAPSMGFSNVIPQETLLKVLFTTAARSSPLQTVLDNTQLLHTDSLRVESPAMGVPFPPDSDTVMMDL